MKCCVQSCVNTKKKKKLSDHNISFHSFPKDPTQRAAWIDALGVTPTEHTQICSDHFTADSFFNTKAGARRLNFGAVPYIEDDIVAPAVMRICKICLALDTKLFQIRRCKLDKMLKDVTGIAVTDNDFLGNLPTKLCWECVARLKSAAALKTKALFADMLLRDMLKTTPFIKVYNIRALHEKYDDFKSKLDIQKLIYNRDVDDRPKSEEVDVPNNHEIAIPNNDEIETDVKDLILKEVRIKDEGNNQMMIAGCEPFNDDSMKTEVDLVPTSVDVTADDRNDDNALFDDDIDDSASEILEAANTNMNIIQISDDDEAVIEVNTDVQNTEGDIDMGFSEVIQKSNGDATSETVPQVKEKNAVKNVVSKRMKNEKSVIKKQRKKKKYEKPKLPLDDTVITTTLLTYEQMLEEVRKRKESDRYKDATYKCNVCYRWFPTQDMQIRHALKHNELSGTYECDICKSRFKHRWALRGHMSRQHTTEYSCKQCIFVSRSRNVALGHVRFHAGSKYKCPQCSVEFERKTTLLNHLRLKHISDLVCELCGYTFISKHGVHAHKRLKHPLFLDHMALEGPFCDVCDVQFLSQKAYDRHLRLSSKHIAGEDDPQRMSNDPSIKSRLGRHHRSKAVRRPVIHSRDPNQKIWKRNEPVDCEQCGLNLPNLHAYACHFKTTHPGMNRTKFPYMKTPYMCEQCGKMFLNTTLLTSHQWVHTGKKCFQCDHCSKSFSQKANLVNHIMNLHDTERRFFDCRVCGKLFTSQSNRTRHMFLHTGLKPYKCEACEKRFPTSGELRSHVDHVHLKKPRPKRVRRKTKKYDGPNLEY